MTNVSKAFILLHRLSSEGKLVEAVQSGVVKPRHKKFYDIYTAYILERSRFKSKCMKVVDIAERFNTSPREVYNAIIFMEN